MPEMVADHDCECVAGARLCRDCLHGRVHEVLYRSCARSKPAQGELPQNVSLSEDANDAAFAYDCDRADMAHYHRFYGLSDRRIGPDDGRFFIAELKNTHSSPHSDYSITRSVLVQIGAGCRSLVFAVTRCAASATGDPELLIIVWHGAEAPKRSSP